jgi:hypothetical protein
MKELLDAVGQILAQADPIKRFGNRPITYAGLASGPISLTLHREFGLSIAPT